MLPLRAHVVYGTGWIYYPWVGPIYYYPRPYTWGFCVHYGPYTGWTFRFGAASGFYHYGMSWGYYGYGPHPGYWGGRRLVRPGWLPSELHPQRRRQHQHQQPVYAAAATASRPGGPRGVQLSNNLYQLRDARTGGEHLRPSGQPAAGGV